MINMNSDKDKVVTIKCDKCGYLNSSDSKFCDKCGNKLEIKSKKTSLVIPIVLFIIFECISFFLYIFAQEINNTPFSPGPGNIPFSGLNHYPILAFFIFFFSFLIENTTYICFIIFLAKYFNKNNYLNKKRSFLELLSIALVICASIMEIIVILGIISSLLNL